MMPKIVACGGREKAYDKFKIAHLNKDETSLLLVDAEESVQETGPWRHLKVREDWDPPNGAKEDQCHLMVEVMESWFLADRDALKEFYGQGYRQNALRQNPQIEQIDKDSVLESLKDATRNTQKGPYHKGSHSFEILVELDPEKVMNASPHAKRFIEALFELAQS